MTDYSASLLHLPNNTTILQLDHLRTSPGIPNISSIHSPTASISLIRSSAKGPTSEARSRSKPTSTSHHLFSPSHLGTRLAFGAAATDPYTVYQDQLTNSRSKAGQKVDNSRLSAKTVSQFSSSVVVGAKVAGVDRRNTKSTVDHKADQKATKERLIREKAARKAAGRFGDKEDFLGGGGRNDSISSTSLTGSSSSATRSSTDPSTNASSSNPFKKLHGRRYLRDATLPYPLPCDLMEVHRQTMLTMLLVQVFGGPVCTPNFQHKPPKKVLEVACGTGYWSSLCHQYFARQGHSVSFTGLDIAPLCPDMGKEYDMKWDFVQHDLRREPLPFDDEEFDLIMVKDLSLVVTPELQHNLMDEYMRILQPGGSLEIWDGDHTLRMLLPQTPSPSADDSESESEDEEQERANATGTYPMTALTKLTAPQNQYLHDYNGWIAKALDLRKLTLLPCSHIRPLLLQESDLAAIESRRLAIPLGEVRWEREGIGGTISKDSPGGPGTSSKQAAGKGVEPPKKSLSTGQAALRRTALLTVVQKIEALEPYLRDASGKSYDEWDRWLSSMMNNLMKQNGTSWGECIEVGAWWATKRVKKKP